MKNLNKKLTELLASSEASENILIEKSLNEIEKSYTEALREIKRLIASIFEKLGDNITFADVTKYNRLSNLENQIVEILREQFKRNVHTTKSLLIDLMRDSYNHTVNAHKITLGVNLGFGLLSEETIKASIFNPMDRIKWTNRMEVNKKFYINQLKTELTQGFIRGDGYGKIAKRVTEKTDIDKFKVMRILRTEGHRVQNAARVIAFDRISPAAKRRGIEIVKIWVATLDERTRSSHREIDGQEANMIDGKLQFTLPSGVHTVGPGLSGIAEEDINCRCRVAMKVKKFHKRKRKN